MHLSKSQRHTAYIIMREELKEGRGFCEVLFFKLGISDRDVSPKNTGYTCLRVTELFPELIKRKPKICGVHWFEFTAEGYATRLRILDECIKETY